MLKMLSQPHAGLILLFLAMGMAGLLTGSGLTFLYFAVAFYVIFLNPKAGFMRVMADARQLYRELPVLWVIPAYLVVLVVTTLLRENPVAGAERLVGYLQFLVLIPMAAGLFAIAGRTDLLAPFAQGCRFAMFPVLLFVIFELVMNIQRPEAMLGNSLILAAIASVTTGIAMMKFAPPFSPKTFFVTVSVVCGSLIAVLSLSRSAFLYLFVCFVIAVIYHRIWQVNFARMVRYTLSGLVVFALIIVLAAQIPAVRQDYIIRYYRPIEQLSLNRIRDISVLTRMGLQVAGFSAFKQKPFTGHGIQNVISAAANSPIEFKGKPKANQYTHLHNDYLTHAVAGGIPFFAFFLVLLFSPIMVARTINDGAQKRNAVYFALFVSILYATFATTNVIFGHDILTSFFALSFVLVLVSYQQARPVREDLSDDEASVLSQSIKDGL